jgi:hypothetical protein
MSISGRTDDLLSFELPVSNPQSKSNPGVCDCACAADIPGGSILGSTDERLRLGFDCLMAQLPFWLAGQAGVVQQLVTALEYLQVC